MHTCLTTQSQYHQNYRGWNQVRCRRDSITHIPLKHQPTGIMNVCDHERHVKCGDGSCILNTGLCDVNNDYSDGANETDCIGYCEKQDIDIGLCNFSYSCKNGQNISISYICDGTSNCMDGSDKEACAFVVIPIHDIGDYISEHLQTKINGVCEKNMLMCDLDNNGFCYHHYHWCVYEVLVDYVLQCPGLQHLQFCENYECPSMYQCSMSYCIPMYMTCNGVADCPEGDISLNISKRIDYF